MYTLYLLCNRLYLLQLQMLEIACFKETSIPVIIVKKNEEDGIIRSDTDISEINTAN